MESTRRWWGGGGCPLPLGPVAVSRTVKHLRRRCPAAWQAFLGVAAPLLPHQRPSSLLASIKETSRSPCEERDRPSYSTGMSLLDPCPALSCPLSCPVTGCVEGRDVGDTRALGLPGPLGVQERAQLEGIILQKSLSSESNAAGRREFPFPSASVVPSAMCARALGSLYLWRREPA